LERRSQGIALAIAALLLAVCASSSYAQSIDERLQLCGTCHGENGNSKLENTPSLAGQPQLFLVNQLILMREGIRTSEVMAPFVKGLKDDEIIALASHYAKLAAKPGNEAVDKELAARGAKLAAQMQCASCHLPTYAGREQIPRISYQRLDYLIESMLAYRDGRRSGIDTSMNGVLYGFSDQDIRALAHYIASIRR
jgi:cytochrome c553